MSALKLLLADDDSLVVDGLVNLFSNCDEIDVVATASNGLQAKILLSKTDADLALLDIDMPGMSGVELAEYIRDNHQDIAVVMFTAFEQKDTLKTAIEAGVRGFFTKDYPFDLLVSSLIRVHNGDMVMDNEPVRMMVESYYKSNKNIDSVFVSKVEALSERDRLIFDMLIEGLPNKVIARKTGFKETSIRMYVTNILRSTGTASRNELIVKAAKSNLI